MSGISINSNIAALNAQRRLSQNSSALSQSFERLSSGLRINRASDDAAGLAISESLKTDSRVYTQAVRNVNDGISLLSTAQKPDRAWHSVRLRNKRQNNLLSRG
jgi:flagellin